jgi:hypothetical protein
MNIWRNVVLVALAGACLAPLSGWSAWFGARRIETLVVTGNFAKSRLLAELYQRRTKQPILIVSPEGINNDQLFYLPSKAGCMALDPAKYAEWVEYLSPTRVIFLGDTAYVPQTYVDQVRGRFPVVILNGRDWLDNAKALGGLIKDKGLAKLYGSYFEKIDAAATSLARDGELPAEPPAVEPPAQPQPAVPAQP